MKTNRLRPSFKIAARRFTAGLICMFTMISMMNIALPVSAAENSTGTVSSVDSTDPVASDNGIALTALDDENKNVMKEYFKQFPGEYTLPDGSGWKVTVSDEGDVSYVGDYVLSKEYGNVYNNDIEGIGNWYIEAAENGHVYLHEGDKKYEAVMTAGTATNNLQRVNTMVAALPGWYTDSSHITPAYAALTWGCDKESSKSSNYGKGALYFETTGLTKLYKEDGGKVQTYIPPMRFERSEFTEFAKSYLKNYKDTYYVNDGSGETIVIGEDGIPVLRAQDGKDLTPLYYNVNNAEWLADDPEGSKAPPKVTSVVYSAADWYAQNAKSNTVDRTRLTLNWDEVSKQFAVSAEAACCEDDGSTVSHIYTTDMKYSTAEDIKEVEEYMTQYVKGEYTLNDGSGWKIKVDENTGIVSTKFGTDDYADVLNPAPVFKYDATHTSASNTDTTIKEWGNDGRYLSTISVPVKGWYIDEECKQEAVVTLTWNGEVANPIDDHQFNLKNPIPLYRKTDGEVECKYMAGTFYSDADREKGKGIFQQLSRHLLY